MPPPTSSSWPGRNTADSAEAMPLLSPAAANSGIAQQAAQPMNAATAARPTRRLARDGAEICGELAMFESSGRLKMSRMPTLGRAACERDAGR
jgi:hypothetical protein